MTLCHITQTLAAINGVGNKMTCDSEKISPLGDCHRATAKSYSSDRPGVIHLLFSSRPSDIFWRVIAVVISTIELFASWFFTNVFQKIGKRFGPTLAHFYTSRPVIFIASVVRVLASALYGRPDVVHFRSRLTVRFSRAQALHVETPATCREPSSERLRIYKFTSAAFTQTFPMNLSANDDVLVGDDKSPEFLSRNIVEVRHG